MKKALSLVLALALAMGTMMALSEASVDLETWFVKTGDGKGLNVRDINSGEKIGVLPYGSEVSVEYFSRDGWAVILWGGMDAKVKSGFLVAGDPGKYQGPVDSQGNVLSDSALGSETVEGMNKQYSMMRYGNTYKVMVVPDTRTGTARLRWGPSKNTNLVAQLPANYELNVLASSSNWLLVQDPNTGKIGYIATKYTTAQ